MTAVNTSKDVPHFRIGLLLTEAGIIDSDVLDDAIRRADRDGQPFLQILASGGKLTQAEVNAVVWAQSLIWSGSLEVERAIEAMKVVHECHVSLDEGLEAIGWTRNGAVPASQSARQLECQYCGSEVNIGDIHCAICDNEIGTVLYKSEPAPSGSQFEMPSPGALTAGSVPQFFEAPSPAAELMPDQPARFEIPPPRRNEDAAPSSAPNFEIPPPRNTLTPSPNFEIPPPRNSVSSAPHEASIVSSAPAAGWVPPAEASMAVPPVRSAASAPTRTPAPAPATAAASTAGTTSLSDISNWASTSWQSAPPSAEPEPPIEHSYSAHHQDQDETVTVSRGRQPASVWQRHSASAEDASRIVATLPPRDAFLMGFLSACCLAGLGQLLIGQKLKGCLILIISIVAAMMTGGYACLVILPLAGLDAYLLADKLRNHKTVGQWESF